MEAITRYEAELIVYDAGGEFVGAMDQLILFKSKRTGATLAMHVDRLLSGGIQLVQEHIQKSDNRYKLEIT